MNEILTINQQKNYFIKLSVFTIKLRLSQKYVALEYLNINAIDSFTRSIKRLLQNTYLKIM